MSYAITAPSLALQPKNKILKKTNNIESTNANENISSKIPYKVENNTLHKNKTKIAIPAQYSMSFPNDSKVIYILVFIKFHIGNDMDQGHYVCDLLDYNTGTWWNYDDKK